MRVGVGAWGLRRVGLRFRLRLRVSRYDVLMGTKCSHLAAVWARGGDGQRRALREDAHRLRRGHHHHVFSQLHHHILLLHN